MEKLSHSLLGHFQFWIEGYGPAIFGEGFVVFVQELEGIAELEVETADWGAFRKASLKNAIPSSDRPLCIRA